MRALRIASSGSPALARLTPTLLGIVATGCIDRRTASMQGR
ncbi:MAG: hypothetical protein ACR2JL_05070 [Candidatus Limnocylindrus sp.]